jgi:hypothetical protein
MAAPGVGGRACPGLSRSKAVPAMSAAKTSVHTAAAATIAILVLVELEANRSKSLFIFIVYVLL